MSFKASASPDDQNRSRFPTVPKICDQKCHSGLLNSQGSQIKVTLKIPLNKRMKP